MTPRIRMVAELIGSRARAQLWLFWLAPPS
jgi:hypothetical protein